jgi:putative FmdB family regulatory protein
LYDYVCGSCGHHFEALLRGTEQVSRCPRCQAADPQRQISSFAVSSAATRKASFAKARAASLPELHDKEMAHQEYIAKHHH